MVLDRVIREALREVLIMRDMWLFVPACLVIDAQIREGNGAPDGIRCDAKGNVWVSTGEGINVFAPDGDMIAKVLTPVRDLQLPSPPPPPPAGG